ncbi:serine hydrolase domain-containing protein [Actinocrispum wychmicini]|uniref:CubicO group peptidase (Beta-lactamase class C family) n=1 Tax=Actinocrispum wychmicini TaxID=1213861 RepID=A0A4R2JFS7_9PSEU|nr:serine hydrolase domain-containing protein [Actinocrispum wychmicini]TCO53115.1 CubicO group peptidase (beta-lactamase class C family) [Actinocrispum wychmicini]
MVLDLIRARDARAQICVMREGQVVLDSSVGCGPDTPFLIFSAGKPFVAMLVHLLAERGQVSLADPVARHWPEFGRRGKETITIRQVLQHRSGLHVARGLAQDALMAPSWRMSVRALETARPSTKVPAYHVISYGFILGELVQRVTGKPLRDVLRAELLEPLNLTNTHLGTPKALWPQHIPIRADIVRRMVFNTRLFRQAVIPAATISTTARDLARFYQMLVAGGELDGVRVLAPATIAQARHPSSDGETDNLLRVPIRWSQGFQLGDPASANPRPMGRASSPNTFGHNGSNCCLGWADPDRGLAFAYLTNKRDGGFEGSPHQTEVSDAVLATYG